MLESRESDAVSSAAQNDARLVIDAQHRFLVESFPVSFSDFFNARAAALVVNWVKQDHEHGSLDKRRRRFVTLFFLGTTATCIVRYALSLILIMKEKLPMVARIVSVRSEEHTSELQSLRHLVCRLLLEKK